MQISFCQQQDLCFWYRHTIVGNKTFFCGADKVSQATNGPFLLQRCFSRPQTVLFCCSHHFVSNKTFISGADLLQQAIKYHFLVKTCFRRLLTVLFCYRHAFVGYKSDYTNSKFKESPFFWIHATYLLKMNKCITPCYKNFILVLLFE